MKPAQYAVIRYIADPVHNEAQNVGILAWGDEQYRVRVDAEAAARVVRDHPWLGRDALLYLEPHLRAELDAALERVPTADEAILRVPRSQKGYPVLLSEARSTSVLEEGPQGRDETVDRLVKRLVIPRRRGGGGRGGGPSPTEEIGKQLRPLILQGLVQPNYAFSKSRSGIPRTVDFFANSTTNVAIDAVCLALRSANEIQLRADAEAFKVEDIRADSPVGFITYCQITDDPEMQDVFSRAFQVLVAAGAKVVTTPEAAVERLRLRANR
jgi:hypothetical protein